MRALVYLTNESELKLWQRLELGEVIIGVKNFSRRGTLNWDEAIELQAKAQNLGLKTSFEWDALMEEGRFLSLSTTLKNTEFAFKSIRVRDAGAAIWVRDNLQTDIHLLLEAGHHNKLAIKSWQSRLGERLKRIVVSPELPLNVLKQWRSEFPQLEIEVLALGPLLLFHSPRPLLSSLEHAPSDEEIVAAGASEESPHKGFPLYENQHGTLMFHPKDLGLLERWFDMQNAGIDFARIDHRQQSNASIINLIATFISHPVTATREALREAWDREWMRGYWDVNKSDVLFDKLKNQHLKHSEKLCAEVLEGKRESWLAVRAMGGGLAVGSQFEVVNPEGEKRTVKLAWLKDDAFHPIEMLQDGQIGFIPWTSGAPAKSKLQIL